MEGLGWRVVEQQIAQERTWSMEHTKTWIQQRLKDGPHCAAFLKNTATQLTAYGLQQVRPISSKKVFDSVAKGKCSRTTIMCVFPKQSLCYFIQGTCIPYK